MKTKLLQTLTFVVAFWLAGHANAAPLGTSFSYQGRLDDNASPATGLYDFNLKLYDSETGGTLLGPAAGVSTNAVPVTNGVFTVYLDFGGVFDGAARWVEVSVNSNLSTPLRTLAPRQSVLPTPYALYAANAGSVAANAVSSAALANNAVTGQKIANGTVVRSVNGLSDALTIAAGPNITLGALGNTLTISGAGSSGPAWLLNGNSGTDPATNFLGTIDNKALKIRVHNTPALQVFPDQTTPSLNQPIRTSPSIIGGYGGNTIDADVRGSTIAGGGALVDPISDGGPGLNRIGNGGDFSFLGGGAANFISGSRNGIVGGHYNLIMLGNGSVIGGGEQNLIMNGGAANSSLDGGVIGGGGYNTLTNLANWATIAGGISNYVNFDFGFIGGGRNNSVRNESAVVSGGSLNTASGINSTISGGDGNRASGLQSSVGGGWHNVASGWAGVVAGGFANVAAGQSSTVGGGYLNSASNLWSTIAGGTRNLAVGDQTAIGGGYQNTAQGDYAAVAGGRGNYVGTNIVDLIEFGILTNLASYSGIAAGYDNKVSSHYSAIGGGYQNKSFGDYGAIAGGAGNKLGDPGLPSASSSFSAIGGGRDNSVGGSYSAVPGGRSAVASHYGQFAFAAGHMDRPGDAQASMYVLRRKFSGNGDLTLDPDSGASGLSVPPGAVWTLRFQISGVSVAGTNFGSYEVSGVVANVGGITTFRLMDGSGAVVGTARPIYETAGAAGWLATPYQHADGTLRVAVFAGETVKWCARIDVTEVTR